MSDFLWFLYYLGGESALKATLSNNVISGFFYSIRGVTILAGFLSCQFKYDSKPFRTIAQMLLYYSRNSLPVKGIEHISLKKPVCEQLLWLIKKIN